MLDWFRRKFVFLSRVAALLCLIGICVLSLCPGQDVPLENLSDKWRHGFAYFVFAVLLGCAFLNLRWWTVPMSFAVTTLIGLAIEFIQPSFHRDKDMMDAVADGIGAGLGCVVLFAMAAVYLNLRKRDRIKSFNGRPEPINGF